MKKLILILFFASTTINATGTGEDNHTPESKFEISILGGRALNLEDFKLVSTPNETYIFTCLGFYMNFNRTQIGAGLEADPVRNTQTKEYRFSYFAPYLMLNRTFEMEDISMYAGVMAGYAKDNSNYYIGGDFPISMETKGGGFVGGLQAGVLLKVSSFLAINAELAGRIREIKYTTVTTMSGNIAGVPPGESLVRTDTYGRSGFYLPFRLGIRVRI